MSKFNWGMKGSALFLLCAALAMALPAQTLTTLHDFDQTGGAFPLAGLVQATNGTLYGTTYTGGGGGCSGGCGTIFEIVLPAAPHLHRFNEVHAFQETDGAMPDAVLIQGADGNLYSTTSADGSHSGGTVYKITPSGALTTLYNFCSQISHGICTDGQFPEAGLVQGTDGNFYSSTLYGGSGGGSECAPFGCGTIFRITPGGTLKTLHSFDGTDGDGPQGNLVQGLDGNFYGTTFGGGPSASGTVFKITPGGTFMTLHAFNATGGAFPAAGLVQGIDGNFYGTTSAGAGNGCGGGGCGTVFQITPGGTLTTLHTFSGTDGAQPLAGLVQGTDGNFYGATYGGGTGAACTNPSGCGTLFKITASGALTTLYNFCSQSGCTDGADPIAELIQDTNGTFYGTTQHGGISSACGVGCGTVFSLSVGLGPFVETDPGAGRVGARIKILGTSLTGATSVTFNGTAATFTVVSSSEITTTVPAGATTGTVEVITPSGALSSNVPFRVLP